MLIVKDLSASHALPVERCPRSWEGAQPGQLTQTVQRDIPCHDIMLSI